MRAGGRAGVCNTCALHGKQVDNAFKMLVEMRRANCAADKITYSTLIKACVAKGQVLVCVCVCVCKCVGKCTCVRA